MGSTIADFAKVTGLVRKQHDVRTARRSLRRSIAFTLQRRAFRIDFVNRFYWANIPAIA